MGGGPPAVYGATCCAPTTRWRAVRVAELPSFLTAPPRCLFFTGKGGVGKTSVACAAAIAPAEAGRRVLLISTDPASNLDEMLGVALSDTPRPVPGVAGLEALNIDPEAAAEAYRARVLAQMEGASEGERATVREQLSGACTNEVAAFDEFAALLAGETDGHDHLLFDTAPTGHTLRLLNLPAAWIINRALTGSGTTDPLLTRRMAGEAGQIARIKGSLARRTFLLPWQAEAPVGLAALRPLAAEQRPCGGRGARLQNSRISAYARGRISRAWIPSLFSPLWPTPPASPPCTACGMARNTASAS
ncbi:TRC40/GET3/ArsA family transport-energizing ATPase [Roseomonas eburnea]|uniref:arsenite-transporting ATPase n=2 Tax=Neoroseomonas eburnea TaxID=1346889 RepID=A0A9X9XG24_9PROT|nr:TRC40/GET3/ArsA family transport-energizing ATPase [Neoroseomonas eburnea]MBR0682660.1 TRC40/GET3/ArsA family transport-energizing ATPase [Neoroseomonas eburnea]